MLYVVAHVSDDNELLLYRVGGPIFFANVDKFVDQLYRDVLRPTDSRKLTNPSNVEMSELHSPNATVRLKRSTRKDAQGAAINEAHEVVDRNDNTEEDGAPQHVDSGSVRVIVLDFSRVTFVDSMAVAALKKIYAAYRNVGIQLVLSGCDAKVTTVMAAACLLGDPERQLEMYPTVHDAVVAVG